MLIHDIVCLQVRHIVWVSFFLHTSYFMTKLLSTFHDSLIISSNHEASSRSSEAFAQEFLEMTREV